MSRFIKKNVAAYTPEQKENLDKVIAALSAEAQLKPQLAADQKDAALIEQGKTLIREQMKCTDCHEFGKKDEDATAPSLTGYGSRKWLINFIGHSSHADFYGDKNDRMPAFGPDQILTPHAIGLIADWLRGSWYEPSESTANQDTTSGN
jgi:ubiquinol-cytochrome c reductase cytochrome b subunit